VSQFSLRCNQTKQFLLQSIALQSYIAVEREQVVVESGERLKRRGDPGSNFCEGGDL
jgi:hypothetical protein